MKTDVRYYSKLGNTKAIAESIAEGAGVRAISITDEPALTEKYDILFLGGAPYANIMDPTLRQYCENLSPEAVGKVILFTTSNWSRRTIYAIRKILKEKGIPFDHEYFYAHMLNIKGKIPAAKAFGAKKVSC